MARDNTLEKEIQAKGLTAARITAADVEASIASEHYFTSHDGATVGEDDVYHEGIETSPLPKDLALVTICTILMRNGHRIVGFNTGPVSAANFDPVLGRKLARQHAIDQIWPLLGFSLREKLSS